MRKSFRYRIYPTPKQEATLDEQLRLCRWLYNAGLEQRIWAWKKRKLSISKYDQMRELSESKLEHPEFKLVNSQVLQGVLQRLDQAYQRFFSGAGFPRFKSRDRFKSMTFTQTGYKLGERKLKLANVGEVRIKLSRPTEGEIKTLTITRDSSGHWYASFSCDLGSSQAPRRQVEVEAGIDLGLEKFLTCSDGSMVPNPRHFRESEAKLTSRHRKLASKPKQKRTRNREKAKLLVAKAYEKVRNQRRDFHFKLANYLIRTYDRIAHEDLNIRGMSASASGTVEAPGSNVAQKAGVNKSILDAGWRQFLEILRFKAESAGVEVIGVDPRNTSQVCSSCGSLTRKGLNERVHACDCGLRIDRDWNAALNILRLGQSLSAS